MPPEPPSAALFTDLYQLTMAQAYWQSGKAGAAVFSLYFREYPPDRAYFVFAGLEDVLDYLEGFRFTEADLDHLRQSRRFDAGFLDYLSGVRFTGSVRAMEEGALLFAAEPAVEVSGPMIEAQLVETCLINQVQLQTMLATKASRVVYAAGGKSVMDFAARRTHGMEAAYRFSRGAYMAGFEGTSNMGAALAYGIPPVGTMAHSFVQSFEDETDAFRAYARSFPDSSTFLIDTYDTIDGVRRAIEVAGEMRAAGHRLRAVRLDSGDLESLSRRCRAILDGAGFPEVEIVATGGLDEFAVDALLSSGAPIDGFGVGTKAGVSADAPWTDCAYKLVQYEGRPVMKLSEGKETLPGPKQIHRIRDADDAMDRDLLTSDGDPAVPPGTTLLREVMRDGRRTGAAPALGELRRRFRQGFGELPDRYKTLRSPPRYPVEVSPFLASLRDEAASKLRRPARTGDRDCNDAGKNSLT